jgi:hypothetical protein
MKVYNLTSDSYLVLDSVKTKNGFKHEATLVKKPFEDNLKNIEKRIEEHENASNYDDHN